jgi:hypothetical protein
MQRRTFIGGSAATLAALLCVADAAAEQPTKLPVIGFLSATSPGAYASRVAAFQRGLEEAGFVEGRNVVIGIPLGRGPL